MQRFARLYDALDATNSTAAKTAAMVAYFAEAPAADAAWCVHLLGGERLPSAIASRDLAAWAADYAGVTEWMFDACYQAVGDRAETIALLIDAQPGRTVPDPWQPTLSEAVRWVQRRRGEAREAQREALLQAWSTLDARELFLFNKLLTGPYASALRSDWWSGRWPNGRVCLPTSCFTA